MPAVIASKPAAPGYPTILLYAHHDVQPPGDNTQWETDPFTAVQKGARLYGRGAADDKAGVITHMAAFRLVSEVLGNDFNVGVKIFIEGEEEAGSPSFREFLFNSMAVDGVGRFALVWNNSRWYAGASAILHAYNYRKSRFSTNNMFGTLNFYVGYNFGKRSR